MQARNRKEMERICKDQQSQLVAEADCSSSTEVRTPWPELWVTLRSSTSGSYSFKLSRQEEDQQICQRQWPSRQLRRMAYPLRISPTRSAKKTFQHQESLKRFTSSTRSPHLDHLATSYRATTVSSRSSTTRPTRSCPCTTRRYFKSNSGTLRTNPTIICSF